MSKAPDFIVGDPKNPYLLRWWILPRNRFFNIYLHKFLRDDDARALHDHPYFSISIILKGCYFEQLFAYPQAVKKTYSMLKFFRFKKRVAGQVIFRRASTAHKIILKNKKPCWSLFITGPRVREWGFYYPEGWRPWRDFVSEDDNKGCS